jgi:hypothetical protein
MSTSTISFDMDDRDGAAADEPQPAAAEEDGGRRRFGIAGWLISLAAHSLLILLMSMIYFLVHPPETDTPPVRLAVIEPPPKKEDKPKELRTLEAMVEIDVVAEAEVPNPVTQLDLPVEVSEREEENESPVAKGREEAVADSEMGGSGAFMAIGAGGGGSGMFGSRSGGGKKRALAKGGGSKGSESAVDASLRWLKKHQDPTGMWHAKTYMNNCQEQPKCEPGGVGWVGGDDAVTVAQTGYGVLCFLGAGYDHQTPNKYRQTVKKGLEWLVAAQKPDGRLGNTNYENGIATMALAEAFAMTGDPSLKGPAQRGVNVILACQNQLAPGAAGAPVVKGSTEATGLGWDYFTATGRNDTSLTGWNVMALKSALAAQLDVGQGMAGAASWLDKTWKKCNPDWASMDPYKSESFFPYAFYPDESVEYINPANVSGVLAKGVRGVNFTCAGMVCAVFLGHHAGDLMLETMANEVLAHQLPTKYPCNAYYLYYNSLGVFQVGGERWKKWNGVVRDLLVNSQRKNDGCFDGSWDWQGTEFLGHDVGRVLITEYNCLSLEVYYRYAQVGAKKH